VHRHVANIFTKLDVDSRTAAVAYAIKERIVEVGIL
jgi:DNA-binding NarL/FixJ family response regulator